MDAYKTKAESLEGDLKTLKEEFATYKADVDTKAITAKKQEAAEKQLVADGANPKLAKLLLKEIDLDSIKVGEDGAITNWDAASKSVKTSYADVFGTTTTTGAGVANPPVNTGGVANPWKKGEHYSLKDQTELYRKDPDKARQLAAAAGVKL